MAITVVDTQKANPTAAGTTGIVLTKPTGLADGDVMFAFVSRSDWVSTVAWTCSGWTDISPATQGSISGNDTQCTILRKVVVTASGEPSSYTFVNTQATSYKICGIITALRGVDPNTPVDITVAAYTFTANNANPATVNGTSATDQALAIKFVQISLAAATRIVTPGAPSGYTLFTNGNAFTTSGSVDNQLIAAYKTMGNGGDTAGTGVWTGVTDPGTAESLTGTIIVRALRSGTTRTFAAAAADVVTSHTVSYEFASPRQTVMSRSAVGRMIR